VEKFAHRVAANCAMLHDLLKRDMDRKEQLERQIQEDEMVSQQTLLQHVRLEKDIERTQAQLVRLGSSEDGSPPT